MLKMSSQIENIVTKYKQLSKIPTIVGGRLTKHGKSVSSTWSVRNLDLGKNTKFAYNYTIDEKLNVVGESEFASDVSNELLSAVSPSQSLRAVIREQGEKDSKKQYLEVWSARSLAHSVCLNALEVHGDVYADSEFKSLEWSPDEGSIVYIAEKKLEKGEPFFKRKAAKDVIKPDNGGDTPISKGEEYKLREDWGEQLVGKHLSVIAVFTLGSETVNILKGVPEPDCPAQVKWSSDGKSIVGVAWKTEPRRLGLIFCTNRPSYIFSLTLDGQFRKISHKSMAVRSPRFVSGQLVWLQRGVGGPHDACHQIVGTQWPLTDKVEIKILVDIVQDEATMSDGTMFYGVYSQALPPRCSASAERLVFSTRQKTTVRSYVVEIGINRLVDISDKSFPGSISVLDVQDDFVLASRTNLINPSQLVVAKLPAPGEETNIDWRPISSRIELPSPIAASVVEYLHLEHDNNDSVKKFSAIYFGPAAQSGRKLPLVVWPHGGPHSNFADAYSLEAALFVSLGFACLQINYRGSTGCGQESVEYLLSRIGTADVQDCKMATEEAVKRFPINDKQICLFGGSHGGFLVTHLSGQYPEYFSSVVSRNPVTDVSSMFNSTDIADWCAVEAGFDFTEVGAPSEEQLVQMRRASPLTYVHQVRAPTALMLGSVDKRVPHYQGLEYYRRLKANGCVTQIFMYEDNHSLSSLPVEMDNIINSILWFFKHSKID